MISEQSTYGALVLAAIDTYPDRIAFQDGETSLSYDALGRAIAAMAEAFSAAGLAKGRAVAILAPNRVEYFVVMATCALAGIRYTPLHPLGSVGDHLAILEDAEIDALIFDPGVFGSHIREIAATTRYRGLLLSLGPHDGYPDLLAVKASRAGAAPDIAAVPSSTLAIAYTGGTTGRPKGVILSHRSVVAAARLSLAHWQWPDEVRILLATPLSHAAGAMILPTLLRGGTIVLHRTFDPALVLGEIAARRITTLFLVPTMVYLLLDILSKRAFDTSSLRLILYGAAPMSPARLAEALEKFGSVFLQIYGQTECSPTVTALTPADHREPRHLLSCGRPLVAENFSIFDRLMLEVADGDVGEICVRGPTLMDGYWKRPGETALRDGWLHTGDLARRDADGFVYIVDREKDMIISGGFNVFPREIEDIVNAHPGVRLSTVVGVPDAKWGEVVHCLVVRANASSVTGEELTALVREKKGAVHAPKAIEFVDTLPLTALGKVDKKAVRARFWQGRERSVG